MKQYLVTLKNYGRPGTTLNDSNRHIYAVEASTMQYLDGDLLFVDDHGGLIRGIARGEWVTFRLATIEESEAYAVAG